MILVSSLHSVFDNIYDHVLLIELKLELFSAHSQFFLRGFASTSRLASEVISHLKAFTFLLCY